MPAVLTVEALAKVNLGLYILYRRPDTFHELRTVFQTISLSDRIEIRYSGKGGPDVELTCNWPDLEGHANLAARAASRLLEETGLAGQVKIHLEKRIPIGAGLGGGSSDAAAVLQALASLLQRCPSRELLWRLARELGSDVPFFLVGGRAAGVGRGEQIYPLPEWKEQWVLLTASSIPIATAEAYRRLSPELTFQPWEDKIDRFCSRICVLEPWTAGVFKEGLENDFEPVVFRMYPELEKLKARLQRLGARPALLCGSGSALFGIFADRRQALRAQDSLDLEDGRCFVVRTVNRRGYRARWERWLKPENPSRYATRSPEDIHR